MKTTKIILLAMLISLGLNTMAQVAINNDGSAPDESAILDLKSTTGGLLLPRLTNVERDAITTPAAGLTIFNTDEEALQIYDGTSWKYINLGSCVPQQPSSITGNNYPDCNQAGITYSITEVPWASSYNWTVPSGATVISGQGTTSVTVDMGTQSGNVSVRAESGCGNSAYKDLPITIGIPAQPDNITGNAYPDCNATAIDYLINPVNGALNYTWTVPSDATIVSGQGTTSIIVDFVATSGNVSVRAENSCGNGNYKDLIVTVDIPAQPNSVIGSPGVPENSTRNYTVESVNGATAYNWTVPADATISSGQGTANITIDFGITSGNVSVRAENSCGVSDYFSFAVTIRNHICGDQFEDSRDGQIYNNHFIDTQCWFDENINIGTRIDAINNQTDNSIIEKYCYNDDDANCTIYGGLYQWDEMMQYLASGSGIQGICPEGWHLPTYSEWSALYTYLGGSWVGGGKMKEIGYAHWNSPNTGATNTSGFTGLPGGQYSSYDDTFKYLGNGGYWGVSDGEVSSTSTRTLRLFHGNDDASLGYAYSKTSGNSVRCLKN